MTIRGSLDAAVVCGLITERGEAALGRTYERRWERDAAAWRAVLQAIEDAAAGARPTETSAGPPAWLATVVGQHLESMAAHWSFEPAFDVIRTLEGLELVSLQADDTYVLAAVGGIGDRHPGTRATTLRADPELVDKVVWRMFEVEGGGEVSLANVDKYTADDAGWQAAFVELTADGTLPRERVLTSCLAALNRDFSAYRAGWYARLYDALQPSVEEIGRDQAQLCALLRSGVTATVGFALRKLRMLSTREGLDGAATLPALRLAAVAGPKGTAIGAVRLAAEIAHESPDLAGDAADVAAAALEHPHADVQHAAANLITKLGDHGRLERAADVLEPSVHADVLGARARPVDDEDVAAPTTPTPVAPVTDGDLVDRLAALLEDAGDPIEVELVLDALARLDDPALLRPVAKRADTILRRGPREGVTRLWLRGQLARLVLVAGREPVPPAPLADLPVVAFLAARLAAIEDVLSRRRPPGALLATPDDTDGWLAPTSLVERLHARLEPPDPHDLVAALLRLGPTERDDALRLASVERGALAGPLADVVRYALGAETQRPTRGLPETDRELDHVPWWIAASRSRMPLERDDWLRSRGVHGSGRSEPIDARVELRSRPFSWTDGRGVHQSFHWRWSVVVAAPARDLDDQEPTGVVGGEGQVLGAADLEDLVGWLAAIHPHDCEHFLVTGVDSVVRAATATEVSHDAVRVLDAIARHPGRLGPLALTALAAGLSASKADQRARAVDAVLLQHQAGRLSADQLAAGLVGFQGPATLTRLAATMRDVAATDRRSRNLVIDALAGTLPAFELDRHGLHAPLDLLREELLREGRPTPMALRPWLDRFGGTSRAAKTAKALLAPP
jgi:hypothetical protein